MMHCVVKIAIFSSILIKIRCFELPDESAWMDKKEVDNFYDYKELKEISKEIKTFNNNIDFELFVQKPDDVKPAKSHHDESLEMFENQNRHLSPNVLSSFLNTIKGFIGNQQQHNGRHHHNKNETSKGIDIAFNTTTNILPAFGNNQDFKFIFVGTKWCGSGDNAKDENDIGYFYLTDHCCREHDLCNETIGPNSEKFGLVNSGKFTRLNCDCDEKFYRCLKRVDSVISRQIGILYFNVLGHQCFRKDYQIVSCNTKTKNRCVDLKKDMNSERTYQWFDNRWF